jgi:hypothetical protein
MHQRQAMLACTILLLGPLAAGAVRVPDGPTRDEALAAMLARALPDGAADAPADGRGLLAAALAGAAFERGAVGPWDVHVLVADECRKPREARKLLDAALEGLAPAAALAQERFGRDEGALSGARFPIVLTASQRADGQTGHDELLALLDRCEDLGYSGWKPDQRLWTDDRRAAASSMTWEVLVLNVEHPEIVAQDKRWLQHGLGYEALNHLVNRLIAVGAWGPAPPWLMQGLVDELDIEAHGEAWVAAGESMSWSSQTAGWERAGWEGFVPKGPQPPPPVYGPPPGLARSLEVKVSNDDLWLKRSNSTSRHWSELAGDRTSDVPASLAATAAAQTYLPRDRAYARCVLHLLLELAPPSHVSLLELLDRRSRVTETGMRDAEPLPVLFARALGGLPEVDALEALDMRSQLQAIGRADLIERISRLGGSGMLDIADHREQARWLYLQRGLDDRQRVALYALIAEVEALQELRAWELIGHALDAAADAALGATSSYPKPGGKREAAAAAFREALSG